ncbi:MAG: ketol-acid reductoisomerase [Chloroflexi bacterium RIFCSPLOWO2_12_FULL_71_12]|nr:MAG: ketol-acid reductoisomerase [Chloroflexi bacterium GWC2_70_10]OGO68619.1 MAG: ketol-acid reductoisomerase [Chloroflexi bacterium RIFCSPLOWO2_02_FULL_71_16]OGO74231.1 MAG: ketol-acid reductoisomerase [Chloroflexi bacterium RIFCSPLOWO2_12_FULL_71_12]
MATIYYDRDADPAAITGKTVAVIGYGSQGHAHAQNLRDSGCQVIVGLAAGSKSWQRAERDGFEVRAVPDAVRGADVVALLVPDQHHREVYEKGIAPFLGRGRTLLVAHAFSVHFGEVKPSADIDVVLVAPKAPGHRMREVYVDGRGVPALLAVHQDATGSAGATGLAYAWGVGATRAGVITTTFAEEVETDLFGEQAVLCGGISELVKAGFETLVEAGYQPEIAYFECMNEMKLIVDLMYEGGLSYMRYSVSDTAEFGDYTSGPRVIDERVRATMRQILGEVRDGSFAQKWIGEYRRGAPTLYATRAREQAQPIEEVGRRLRALMPWLPKRDVPRTGPARNAMTVVAEPAPSAAD